MSDDNVLSNAALWKRGHVCGQQTLEKQEACLQHTDKSWLCNKCQNSTKPYCQYRYTWARKTKSYSVTFATLIEKPAGITLFNRCFSCRFDDLKRREKERPREIDDFSSSREGGGGGGYRLTSSDNEYLSCSGSEIGQGSFGRVTVCQKNDSLVVKSIPSSYESKSSSRELEQREELMREVSLLAILQEHDSKNHIKLSVALPVRLFSLLHQPRYLTDRWA
jgi:hypothetical protein